MTPEQREAWRAEQAARRAALPQRRPRRAEPTPPHVEDPAALALELQARCLRNAQDVTR